MKPDSNNSDDICALCGGQIVVGEMTFTADLKTGLLVVRDVPARVCTQCGAEWVDHEAATRIDDYAQDMQAKGSQVEIVSYRGGVRGAVEA